MAKYQKGKRLMTFVVSMAMVVTSIHVPAFSAEAKPAAQSVKIKKPTTSLLVLKKGKTYKLKAKVLPAKASQKLTYKSSKTSVVTVSKKGVLTAKKREMPKSP